MQTQTFNTLHNAIMEAGSKDRPPILAPVDACPNACEMWKAIERLKQGESINVQDLETNLYWEFGKFTSQDGESLESYYSRSQQAVIRNKGKATVNNPQPIYDPEPSMVDEDDETSKDKEIDKLMALISLSFKKIYKPTNNNLRTSSNTTRESQKPKRAKDVAYHREKMLLCKQEEARIQEEIDQNDDDNDLAKERKLLASLIEKLKCEIDERKNRNKFLETSNKALIENLKGEIEDFKNKNKSLESSNNFFKEANNRLSETNNLLYADYKKSAVELARRNSKEYASQMELECAKVRVQKNAINLELELQQCKEKIKNDMLFKVNKSKDFYKEREQYFEIQDLKAQLQDKGIVISELKKLIEKLKGKSVDTKFEKSSVIRQSNAFKSQRPLVLGKPTTFLNSFVRKDFSKSTSVTQTNVSNDFSKPVTAQTLPTNKKSILKNTNVLAPRIYKLHTDHTHIRTSQLPQDFRKTNKRVSFSTGVILTTSISRPSLKSNPQGDRVMHNNSRGKKQEVEDHHRSVKLSKNKTSITACNDNLNAKTLNVKYISALCDKCVLHDKHDMCVLKFVAKLIKKTVASESNKKPRNFTRKIYERVSKTCSWWYPKFTPSGYKWKPKSGKENVNP
nr:hypothetical protein [Tanacetum cinerariifolium]